MNVDLLRTAAREPWSIPTLEGIRMNSPVVKRSIVVAGAKTSITLEEEFWTGLREIARRRNIKLTEIMGESDRRSTGSVRTATSRQRPGSTCCGFSGPAFEHRSEEAAELRPFAPQQRKSCGIAVVDANGITSRQEKLTLSGRYHFRSRPYR
jgi:hypothetical protein